MCKNKSGGQLSDDLLNVAAGAGYNLTSDTIRGFVPFRGGQVLQDEAMNHVAGGIIDKEDLCRSLMEFFKADLEYCKDL